MRPARRGDVNGSRVVEMTPSALPVPEDAIRAEMRTILGSPQFRRSQRLSAFFSYIVEHALNGRSDGLKEYSIALEVYKRPQSFDAQVDSIVRAEAVRLRGKLEEYYHSEGLNDPVLISVPKGSYSPLFRSRDVPASGVAVQRQRFVSRRVLMIAGLGLVLAGLAIWPIARLTSGLKGGPADIARGSSIAAVGTASLAVLPLAYLGTERDLDLLSDGLTEELIEELSHLPGLRVVSRTSAFQFRGKAIDVREIGRVLNVATLLEGSVRKTGEKLRIIVQLINAADGYHLWSQTYERNASDMLAVQREIAVGVAKALKLQLAGGSWGWDVQRPPPKLEAHNLFLKGRYFGRRWTAGGLRKAIAYYEQAVQLDPGFARAHAELAAAYCELGIHTGLAPGETMPKVDSEAQRALALDDKLGIAHAALGLVQALYRRDWEGAGRQFQRAHELDPADPDVHEAWVMGYLLPLGQFDEALKQIQEAQVLDPVSPRIVSVAGMTHYFAGRYDQAIEELRRALELDPSFASAYLALASAYEQKSAFEEAIATIEKGAAAWGPAMGKSFLGHTYALMGRKADAEALAAEMASLSASAHTSPAYIAVIYAALGQKDRALDWLEKAYQQRSATLAYLKVNPRYDSLRSEPRFKALLKRMNLR